ncbi:MAG: ribulose-phosphate 3-epimerase [Lachnospiraceae bacterium]|nr:ribulose-phosphate 3-epimerase [Lachnospiraceae bacterium]MDD6856778.1 ribulose-phosphate 3-epimerase [Lachnospiraceae bacterium]
MLYLAPSILSADFANLGNDIKTIDNAGADYIHIDVMDGKFVPSISFGMPVMKAIRKYTDKVFDVHLMIEEPGRYINEFKEAGADIITVHAEACCHLNRTLQAIKNAGCKTGVALNPATPLSVLDYVLEYTDMVLIMSVNPGFGGQSYIPNSTQKIAQIRDIIDKRGLDTDIEVDGGINQSNVTEVIDAGANVIVAGSAVFNGDAQKNVEAFKEIFGRYV